MKIILSIAAVLTVGIIWALERMAGTSLHTEIAALQQHSRTRDALQRDRERLLQLQPGAEERAGLRHSAAEHDRLQRELATREQPAPRPPLTQLTTGEWLAPAAWRNRGQGTPAATVETVLWAAAGGEVASFPGLLLVDDAVRLKAADILMRLPPASRVLYPSAEHLIAAFTTKAIPLGDAQLVWQHQSGADDAVACVFVKNPDSVPAAAVAAANSPAEKVPPMAPPSNKTKSAYLSLRRIDGVWRVVVPMSAVEEIAKELAGSPAR